MFEKPRCEAYCSFSIFHLFQIMHLSICKDAVKANCLTNRESSKCAGREMDWIHFFMFLDKRNECLTDKALHFFPPSVEQNLLKIAVGAVYINTRCQIIWNYDNHLCRISQDSVTCRVSCIQKGGGDYMQNDWIEVCFF